MIGAEKEVPDQRNCDAVLIDRADALDPKRRDRLGADAPARLEKLASTPLSSIAPAMITWPPPALLAVSEAKASGIGGAVIAGRHDDDDAGLRRRD